MGFGPLSRMAYLQHLLQQPPAVQAVVLLQAVQVQVLQQPPAVQAVVLLQAVQVQVQQQPPALQVVLPLQAVQRLRKTQRHLPSSE